MDYLGELDSHPSYRKIGIRRDHWRDTYFKLPKWVRNIIRDWFWAWDEKQYRAEAEIEYHVWNRRLREYNKCRRGARSWYTDDHGR